MLCYSEPVVVNHGELCWASGWESWCVILSKWLWIMVCYGKPSGCESWYVMPTQWLWIMVCYSEPVVVNHVCYFEPVVVNHGVLFLASGCESSCAMVIPAVVNRDVLCWTKWLWIMMCNAEPGGCESWYVMPTQWLWIMVCYSEPVVVNHVCYFEPVVVNHGVLFLGSGCESWCVILSQWLWIMVCYAKPGVVNDSKLW